MAVATPQIATWTVARNVRMLRRARGWSAERLAEELTKHGVSWNRGVITKLETGRRESVSVAELLALGIALEVGFEMLLDDELAITAIIRAQ